MGSLFRPKIPAPPPPPPPTLVRDEINNVEQVPVNNPDGTITYVTRKIPLSAEAQAEKDELKSIMSESLAEIQKLSSDDYINDESTKNILNAWETERIKILDESFENRARQEEDILAQRGLADSTASQNIRRRRRLDRQESTAQLKRERNLLSSDIRSPRIGLQQNLYGIAASQSDAGIARQQQSALNSQSQFLAANQARQMSLMDYYRQQNARRAQPSIFGGIVGTAAGAAFNGFTGGFGKAAGVGLGLKFFDK